MAKPADELRKTLDQFSEPCANCQAYKQSLNTLAEAYEQVFESRSNLDKKYQYLNEAFKDVVQERDELRHRLDSLKQQAEEMRK